jgi:hypothetical protein
MTLLRPLRLAAFSLLISLWASPVYAVDFPAALEGTPCCGPITPRGAALAQFLDGLDVESLWLAHEHVDWESGKPDQAADYEGPGRATHCSAFAAAVGERLGVYMLRPPEHGQILLATAQTKWFASDEARRQGWRAVAGPMEAQELANQGQLVVIVYASPQPRKPGHIVIVRPSLKTRVALDRDGPEIIQAGTHNHTDWIARKAFAEHPGAWPDGVLYFAHPIAAHTD